MPIIGLSDKRRFSRLGKIRLGEKKKTNTRDGREVEYPSKIDYFKLDPYDPAMKPRLTELFGEKPRRINVALPDDDVERVFPQYYECWSASALHCKGTGETAKRNDGKGNLCDCDCPGPETCKFALDHGTTYKGVRKTGCKRVARLQVVFPELDSFGVFQLDTGSANSIININSALDFVHNIAGRIAWIPLDMIVKAQKSTNPEDGKQITIYVVDILLPVGLRDIATLKPLLTYASEKRIERIEGPQNDMPTDLVPIALQGPQTAAAEAIDASTGEVFEEDSAPFDVDPEPEPEAAPDLSADPDIIAAFDAVGALPAKRAAMIASAADNGWDKGALLTLIAKSAPRKTAGNNGGAKPAARLF